MRTGSAISIGVLAIWLLAGPAQAQPGQTQDPDDTSYKNDMRAVYHNDSGSTITYYLQFYNNIDQSDWRCYLGLDFNEDGGNNPPDHPVGPTDAEDAHIDISLEGGYATLHDRNFDYRSDVSLTREPAGSPHAASGSTAQNTLRMTVSKDAYVNAGMSRGDTGYKYAVACGSTNSPGTWGEYPDYGDRVPDKYEAYPIVHTFGSTPAVTEPPGPVQATPAPPRQTAAPARATPAPTAAAVVTPPPPDPTPDPTPTESEPPTALSSPLVTETSGNSNARGIVAVAAGVLAIASAGGLAVARRRTR